MLTALLVAHEPAPSLAAEFHAYYSRVDSGEPFERFSRTGDYADIIVKLGAPEGKLVFWRGASYLPYWATDKGKWFLDEIVPRRGDGGGRRPDRVNVFSRVALVESTPERVLVYWRYLPEFSGGNPYQGMDPTRFVEEQFEVLSNGKITRTIKQGTPKIDDWNDPLNHTTQVLQLSGNGVREVSRTEPGHSPPAKSIVGNPLRGDAVIRPVREWRFDEATGDRAVESITGESFEIAGHKSLWRKGVSGTALQYDDYNTVVSLPAAKAPAIAGALTLEGWFAIGAYPWNWAPIVQQGDDTGYFLGVDGHGRAGFKLKVGDTWQELVSTNALDRFHWHHAAGTYDRASGTMSLYLDGKLVVTKPVGSAGITTTPDPVQIGKGKPRRPVDPVRASTFTASYSFDGLIDEVRIYDQALAPEQVAASCQQFLPPPDLAAAPDMDRRALPKFNTGGRFGAHYTRLKFYDVWDNLWRVGPYADVVVGFDQSPAKFVFWRGAGHIPMLVNEADQWYSNEFNETWGRSGGQGCQEPMSDKESYFNHVRVIESTPARVVVQWRFPLVDVLHVLANYHPDTGWGDWSDWYYYIYPDGVAVKKMHLWTDGPRNHEWHEGMAILGPNQHPEQVLETDPALIMADLDGHATPYSWKQGPPKVNYRNQRIHVVNYRAQYDPFTIGDFTGGNVYSGEVTPYSVFPSWNHWPVAQIPSDGRYARFPDRAAHCSLTHVYLPDFRAGYGDRPFQEKLLMEGLSRLSAKELAPLARSWLQAPGIESLSDCRGQGYDPSQRAYVLCATGVAPSFRIAASAERPIVNPCFVVRNWNTEDLAKLEVNSAVRASGLRFRQGIVRDPNGRPSLVVWLQHEDTGPTTFTLRGARPETSASTVKPMTWAAVPQVTPDPSAVTMSATALPGIGTEYLFECSEGPGHSGGWQSESTFTDSGLPPDTGFGYRVKARDAYFAETGWSPVARIKTAAAPAPVIWSLDEGEGKTIRDSTGQHEGAIRGAATWVPGIAGKALHLDGKSYVQLNGADDLRSNGSFTWSAWIRTAQGGTILARAGAGGEWQRGGKVMFVQNGQLRFDVGWVGATGADAPVADGKWHQVAVAVSARADGDNVQCFVDGRPSGRGRLNVAEHNEQGLPIRIGFCNDNFPAGQSGLVGDLDEVRWHPYAVTASDLDQLLRAGKSAAGSPGVSMPAPGLDSPARSVASVSPGGWEPFTNNPVLAVGPAGSWDAGALGSMTVLRVGDLFHLYYEAWGVRGNSDADYNSLQIGHATSRDGIHWTKDPANPVLPKGTGSDWDRDGTWDPFVLHEDGVFKMWYGGGMDQHCDWGYATSTNGVQFVKRGQISHLGNVEDDHVIHDPATGRYAMYYWDRKHEPKGLFVAWSANETDFDFARAQPVRIEGLPLNSMHKFTHVVRDDSQWFMCFAEFVRPGCKGCWTGYATSPDGVRWQAQNRRLLLGMDAEILRVMDDLSFMYYGPDGYFDQKGCDIRLAVYQGKLSALAARDGK